MIGIHHIIDKLDPKCKKYKDKQGPNYIHFKKKLKNKDEIKRKKKIKKKDANYQKLINKKTYNQQIQ